MASSADRLLTASEHSQEPKTEDAKEVAKASIEHTVEDIRTFLLNAGSSSTSASVGAGGIQWQLRVETSTADDGKVRLGYSLRGINENGAWSRWLTADFFIYCDRRWGKVGGVSEKMVGSAPLPASPVRGNVEQSVDCMKFTMKVRVDFACWKDSFQEKGDLDDIAFVVEGRRVYANKGYVTYVSPVLRAMLSGNFKEGQSEEVTIKQMSAEDFVTFMRAITPLREPVTDANVQALYGLADVYDVEFLRRDCEKHLLATEGIEVIDKILLAHSLNKLEFITRLLDSLSQDDLKKIQNDNRQDELSAEVKDQLHEREKLFSEAEHSTDPSF